MQAPLKASSVRNACAGAVGTAFLLGGCAHGLQAQAPVATTPPIEDVYVSEPAPSHHTRYRFEFTCERSPLDATHDIVIEGETQGRDASKPVSRITSLSIDRRLLPADTLDRINGRIPRQAIQERPWVTCSDDKISVGLVLRDTGRQVLYFDLTPDGAVDFGDDDGQ